jgi:hypothetical protein
MSNPKTNYGAMSKIIRACKTVEGVERAEKSAERLYLAGVFSVSEYSRLDGISVDRKISIEHAVDLDL